MDRYQKVEKPRPESAIINENEIRITSQGIIRNYVSYATSLLQFGDDTSCFNDFNIIVNQRAKQEFPWFPYMSSSQSTSRDINSPSSLNSNSSFNQNKHKVNLMKIHMYEGVVELEVEEEEGVGEEDTVGLLNMTPIKVDMTTIKEDMAIIKVDMDITKADMVIIKEDMVDTVTNTIMVDGTLTGAVVVDVVEVAGTIEVEDMEGEEVVEGLVGEVMDEDEEGWMAVGEGTKSSTLMKS
ncbi:Alba [Musa troglodytarum]|uniref:Alba n=1 Tax=Musa troglodytarum TaxID=320322 RepID=A0A9E7KR18_9LILI|nr:Alba [Musa troglodytarum]